MSRTDRQRPIAIPTHWTAAQADAVLDFLTRLADEVFLAYEEPLTRLAQREALGLPPADEDLPSDYDDDAIPF